MGSASTPTPTVLLSIPTGEEEQYIPSSCQQPQPLALCLPRAPQTAAARRRRALSVQRGRTLLGASSQPRQPATGFAFAWLAAARQGRPKRCKPLSSNLPQVRRAAASLRARRSGLGTGWLANAGPAGVRNRRNRNAHLHSAR